MGNKYVILVGDGMGDYPMKELGGMTPLEAARTPNIDRLVTNGKMGIVETIPNSMEPGSDVANMSLLGYDPLQYHTGRAPLEAASMGVRLSPDDVAFRCNLVFLERNDAGVILMGDYSAGHISTGESHRIIASLQDAITDSSLHLYPGVSYRHLLVWTGGKPELSTTPPHDISGEEVERYCAVYREEPVLITFMENARNILEDHPVNRERLAIGKRPANAVWLWGQGRAPSMPTLKEKFGINGVMISAVDLLKGLGVYAGLEPIAVPGATGYLDTNYAGKVDAALKALEWGDFAYLHIEAPDEAGHEGSLDKKMQAIEVFDERVVGPMVKGLKHFSKVRLLIVTDHLTPISRRTHVKDPVPFLFVEESGLAGEGSASVTFCERSAEATGWRLHDGVELFNHLVGSHNP
jgi:2,3-bisphosphoglycerate-independent phosphoglycerate mutase